MDEGIAFFHLILNEENQIQAAVMEDCNPHYLEASESYGIPKDQIRHHNYGEIAEKPDPRWNYCICQSAVLGKHVHGGFGTVISVPGWSFPADRRKKKTPAG